MFIFEPRSRTEYVRLFYSLEQLNLCLQQDPDFKPNTYKGKPYTEMRSYSLKEEFDRKSKSCFSDMQIVFKGTEKEYDEAEKAGLIVCN